MNPICQHTIDLSEFIAKQVLCQSGLYLKHGPNVKTLLIDVEIMVSPTQLTVPSAAPLQKSLSANPNQLKTERLENNLRLLWRVLADQLKIIFPDGDDEGAFIIPALDARSHVLSIKDQRKPVDKHLPLLHLSCLFLLFLLKCCNVFSLKPTRSMCDGRLFASSPFCRLACRGVLFRGFPFRWVLHFVLSLTRGIILHDSACCSMEESFDEYGRPCDPLSCLLFSALWLRCNQSILVQETQSAKDTDMTCSMVLPIKATTCLQVRAHVLGLACSSFCKFRFFRIFAAS